MNYINIINKIKKEIYLNKKNIEEAYKIDFKHDNKKIEFSKILEIIDYFLIFSKNNISKIEKDNFEEYVFIYYGDIYLSLYLTLLSIVTNKKIRLYMDEYLIGINKVILEIIINVLKDSKLQIINYSFGHNLSQIREISNENRKTLVIGNSTIYQELYGLKNLRFIPYFNAIIYFDENTAQEKQELIDMIFYYAEENRFEFETLDLDMEMKELIEYSNEDIYSNIVLVLTNDENMKNLLKAKLNKKKLFLNSNPFKKYEENILECLIDVEKSILL